MQFGKPMPASLLLNCSRRISKQDSKIIEINIFGWVFYAVMQTAAPNTLPCVCIQERS